MSIIKVVDDLIEKAKGSFDAASHEVQGAPSEDEKEKETNKANSGTHPENKGNPGGKGSDFEAGETFKDGSEDTIGKEGKAEPGRAGTIKHEGGGSGPNHPGTATKKASVEEADLSKSEDDDKDDDKGEEVAEDKDEAEKSTESGEVFLDIEEFQSEIVSKCTAILEEKFAEPIEKAMDSEYVGAGLAKSIYSLIERVENLEKSNSELREINGELSKAVVNMAKSGSIRKSLLSSAEKKHIDNPSLSGEKLNLSKSEISSRLLDLSMQGAVDSSLVLRFDAVGDTTLIPENIREKIGI